MTNLVKNQTRHNLESFLSQYQSEKFPITALFHDHFKEYPGLKTLSSLSSLEWLTPLLPSSVEKESATLIIMLFRSRIISLMDYIEKNIQCDGAQLEDEFSILNEDSFSFAQDIEKLLMLAVEEGQNISEYDSILSLKKILLRICEMQMSSSF